MNTVLWWLAQDTITIAFLIPIVAVACRFCRNRPAVQHVLWAVVLVKFMMPPVVSWPWRVQHFSAPSWSKPGNASRSTAAVPVEFVPGADFGALAEAGSGTGQKSRQSSADGAEARGHARPFAGRAGVASLAPRILTGLWFLGFVICTVRQVRRIGRHASLVRLAKKAPEALAMEIEAIAGQVGLRPPRALVSRGIGSPFMWFLGRLSLVWPETIAGRDDVIRTRGVIAHELAHVHRGDHYLAWVELFAGLLWWWNPLFWFVRRRVRESAELACDAIALSVCPDNRRRYAELLLELSSGSGSASLAPVLGIRAGTASSFERRLSMILSDRVSGRLPLWGFVAAGALALVTLPAWSAAQKPTDNAGSTLVTTARESDQNAGATAARLEQIESELSRLFGQLEEAKRSAANPPRQATARDLALARNPHSRLEAMALATAAMGKDHWSATQDLAFRYYDAERGYWIYAKEYDQIDEENGVRYDGKRIRLKPFLLISTSHDGKNIKTITGDMAVVDMNKSPGFNVSLDGEALKVLHVHFEGHAEVRDEKGALVSQIDTKNKQDVTARWHYLKVKDENPTSVSFGGKTRNYIVTVKEGKTYLSALEKDGRQVWHSQLPIAHRAGDTGVWSVVEYNDQKVVVVSWAGNGEHNRNTFHVDAASGKTITEMITDRDDDLEHAAAQGGSPSVAERLRSLNSRSDRINLFERDQKLAQTDQELTQELFRSLLNRDPTREELAFAVKHFGAATTAGNRGRAVEDIFWVIINSAEHKSLKKSQAATSSRR